jgi:hypothetical protein
MTQGMAAILGALVGATGGLAGGAFAALASLRASQLAARAPLGLILHDLSNAVIRLNIASNSDERFEATREFQRVWNKFAIQQRILCPSGRIANLMALIDATTKDKASDPSLLIALAGQAVDKVTQMVGAHSKYFLQSRVRREEERIILRWLASQQARDLNLSTSVRERLQAVARPTRFSNGVRRLSIVVGILCSVAIPAIILPRGGILGFYRDRAWLIVAVTAILSFCLGWIAVRVGGVAIRVLGWLASGFEDDNGD